MLSEEELDRKYKEKVEEYVRAAESENYIFTHKFAPGDHVCKWCSLSCVIIHLHNLRCGDSPPKAEIEIEDTIEEDLIKIADYMKAGGLSGPQGAGMAQVTSNAVDRPFAYISPTAKIKKW